ncbi:MAG: phage major capsid protein [Fimbriimonadaceae bacterium]|nr:phage major capsid protein [Fimbriimonadaceae bacterium]
MNSVNHIELGRELESKRAAYKQRWDGYATKSLVDGKQVKDIPANDLEGLRRMMDDINEVASKHEIALAAFENAQAIESKQIENSRPLNRVAAATDIHSVSEQFLKSSAWNGRVGGKFSDVELDRAALAFLGVKSVMTTGSGFAPQVLRDGTVVPIISRPPQLLDLIRIDQTDQNAVKFMKQSTRTNAAGTKGETVGLDEAGIAYSEATVNIRKIGVFLPITEEQLDDEPGVRALIDEDLKLMVRQKLDEQITVGDGTGTNILGLYNQAAVLSQAAGTDSAFDQIMKAMTKVRTSGRAKPNLVVLHSDNYQSLALTKTSDGLYVFGHPGDAPLNRVWGVQIVASEALTAGTGMVLDTDFSRIKIRGELAVTSSNSHEDYFTSNQVAIRAVVRAGLQVLRDQSICRLTGLS